MNFKNSHKKILIDLENVSKIIDNKLLLSGINLKVFKGRSIVILGESGSGKSVFLNMLLGFENISGGKVTYNIDQKYNLENPNVKNKILEHISVVFQDAALLDSYSVLENLIIPMKINGLYKEKEKTKALQLLEKLQLEETDINSKPSELSGGMRKRLAIARALSIKPNIIFYDEPTTGLDPGTAIEISNLIKEINMDDNITSITVTHDYECAAEIADEIYFLNKKKKNIIKILSKNGLEKSGLNINVNMIENNVNAQIGRIHQNTPSPPYKNSNTRPALLCMLEEIGKTTSLLFKLNFPYRMSEVFKYIFDYGIKSVSLILIVGFFIGILMMLQLYESTKLYQQFVDLEIPKILIYNILMLFAPIVTGLLLAGRVGTSISADVGSKKYLNQLKALRVLNIDQYKFILSPMFFALILSAPFLILLFSFAGLVGSYFLWISYSESGNYFLTICLDGIGIPDIIFVFARSLIIGVLIILISYEIGLQNKQNTEDISIGATKAFVYSSIFIIGTELILNYLYSLL